MIQSSVKAGLVKLSKKPQGLLGNLLQPAWNTFMTWCNHPLLLCWYITKTWEETRIMSWFFIGWNHLPKTRVAKCHCEIDWTTQRLPIKSHAVSIEEVPGLQREGLSPCPPIPQIQSLWSMAGVPFHKLLCLKRTWAWTKKKQGPQTATEENAIPNS